MLMIVKNKQATTHLDLFIPQLIVATPSPVWQTTAEHWLKDFASFDAIFIIACRLSAAFSIVEEWKKPKYKQNQST